MKSFKLDPSSLRLCILNLKLSFLKLTIVGVMVAQPFLVFAESSSESMDLSDKSTQELTVETPENAEAEIPVNLKGTPAAGDAGDLKNRIWLGAALVLTTMGLSFWVFKRYKYSNRIAPQYNMKILVQHHLGPRKSLAVVQVAGESILIGVTDHHISHIKTLSLLDDDLPANVPKKFASILNDKKAIQDTAGEDHLDSFALSSIQDVVNRKVKGLRNL